MLARTIFAIAIVSRLAEPAEHADNAQPEQIRLSYGGQPTEMMVTWTTLSAIPHGASNMVEYGVSTGALTNNRHAHTTTFVDPGPSRIVRYIHRATMTNLQPEIRYYYRVGGSAGRSSIFWFTAFPSSTSRHLRVCLFGDLGLVNGVSFGHLQLAAQHGDFDMVIHLGTGLDTIDYGKLQAISLTIWPPITADRGIFIFGKYNQLLHIFPICFDLGVVHFAGFSSELYAYANSNAGDKLALAEYNWLQQDLTAANHRRAQVPWLVMFMHRPMYCSSKIPDDCKGSDNELLRVGNRWLPGLEPVLVSQGIDMAFMGHEHFYERLWPVKNEQTYNHGSTPYHNLQAPVYVVSGSAGCHSYHSQFNSPATPWSAFRANDYGYSVLHIYNGTHLRLDQISVEQDGRVIDSTVISKDAHSHFVFDENFTSLFALANLDLLQTRCLGRDVPCRQLYEH